MLEQTNRVLVLVCGLALFGLGCDDDDGGASAGDAGVGDTGGAGDTGDPGDAGAGADGADGVDGAADPFCGDGVCMLPETLDPTDPMHCEADCQLATSDGREHLTGTAGSIADLTGKVYRVTAARYSAYLLHRDEEEEIIGQINSCAELQDEDDSDYTFIKLVRHDVSMPGDELVTCWGGDTECIMAYACTDAACAEDDGRIAVFEEIDGQFVEDQRESVGSRDTDTGVCTYSLRSNYLRKTDTGIRLLRISEGIERMAEEAECTAALAEMLADELTCDYVWTWDADLVE